MTAEPYLLGIDAGTSVIKAALFDMQGREYAVAASPAHTIMLQPGWSEADMNAVWQITAQTIRQVLMQGGIAGAQVAGIGITGNMVGAWLIDAEGKPVRNAILWNDARALGWMEAKEQAQPGFLQTIFYTSGSVMQPGCTLPIIAWLAEHEPEALRRTGAIVCCKDWLRYKLTGEIATDITEASVMPGDTRARTYSEAMFAHLGVADYRPLLPPVYRSEQIVGKVSAAAAEETGLAVGMYVIAGAGDVPASVLGAGALEIGSACTVLGTTCLNGLILPTPTFEPENVGLLFALPGEQAWVRVMANIAGTTNLDWALETLIGLDKADDVFTQAEAFARHSQPGANGLIYHPYLSRSGVIAPFVEPNARAQFFGLSQEHTRADLLRAVYEGVAFAIRDCYAAMGTTLPTMIRLVGGGARSPLWCQIIADCTGAQIIVPAGSEFGARGAALLAGIGIGWFSSLRDVTLPSAAAYTPDTQQRHLYDAVYLRYRHIREVLLPVWRQG